MKILMSAYACEPNRGSEPGVGWNWALQAARYHDVWVITRSNNRQVIEAALRIEPVMNLHFIYHDLPRLARFWKRNGRGTRAYYLLWQATAVLPALAADHREHFDLIHHVTFNSIESPGFLWLLRRPFIWGPVGGVHIPPPVLRSYFGKNWRYERWRRLRKQFLRYNPSASLGAKKAAVTLAATADTELILRRLGSRRTIQFLEAGVDVERHSSMKHKPGQTPEQVVVLWAGMLVDRKAPLLGLDALSHPILRESNVTMLFVGDGPLAPTLRHEIAIRGLVDHARVLGQVPHDEMRALYEQADIFLFTSLQDTSGNVVLEAMANALPVVCLNHQGVAEIVTSNTGMKVEVYARNQVVADLALAILHLSEDAPLRWQLGMAGRTRVREVYAWDRKGEFLRDLYVDVARTARLATPPGDRQALRSALVSGAVSLARQCAAILPQQRPVPDTVSKRLGEWLALGSETTPDSAAWHATREQPASPAARVDPGHARSYAVTMRSGEPRQLLPADSIRLLHESASIGTTRRLVQLARFGRAVVGTRSGWLGDGSISIAASDPPALERWIADQLEVDDIRLAWSMGTPGAYRKRTAQVMERATGRTLGFLRLADQPRARTMLMNERHRLAELATAPALSGSVPALLGEIDATTAYAILISPAPCRVAPRRFGTAHLDFLGRLAALTPRAGTFAESPFRAELDRALDDIEGSDRARAAAPLRKVVTTLDTAFGDSHLPYTPAHRDFSPWNTRRCGPSGLFVFDWEFARTSWLPLIDLFHFSVIPRLLARRRAGNLWQRFGDEWIGHAAKLGVESGHVSLLYAAYLADVATFYLLARVHAPDTGDDRVFTGIMEQIERHYPSVAHRGAS